MIKTDVLIIGAGLSGLLLAKNLKRACLILEKSRGVGGRIANRRIEDSGFDHGAQYLHQDHILENILIQESVHDLMSSEKGLFVKKSMTRIPKALAGDLNIIKSSRAEKIFFEKNLWIIETDTHDAYSAENLVITAPLPQALELLKKNDINFPQELSTVSYSKALIALIISDDPLSECENIKSILKMRERDQHPNGYVVTMTPEYSEQNFELSDEENLQHILDNFQEKSISYSELKKWRYVLPQSSLPVPYVEVQKNLYLTGDAFSHPDSRGSVKGALALAKKLSW